MTRDPRDMTRDELQSEVEALRYRLQAMTHLEFEGAGQDMKTLVDLVRKHAPETHRDLVALLFIAYRAGIIVGARAALPEPQDPPLPKTGETGGLWRKRGSVPKGSKYLVLRRDGSVPDWPGFVIGARDAAAPAALRAYADEAERRGYNHLYVADIRSLANDFEEYRRQHGESDPTAVPHRKDNPKIVAKMTNGGM